MTIDVSSFMDLQINDSMDTVLIPIPIGEWEALVEGVEVDQWQGKKDPSKTGLKLNLKMSFLDPRVKEATGRDVNTLTYGIMLDTTPGGGLDLGKGKNVTLGRLREAVGLNRPGESFSFRMLIGRRVKAAVKHVNSTKRPGEVFADVDAVTAIV